MSATENVAVSALILAGGQGSRLGGRDKGLMRWRGRPVAQHLAEEVRPLATELLISCNRNLETYTAWADRVVTDDVADCPGPLAGVLAGLEACRGTHLLIVPCDCPRLERPLLQALLAAALQQADRPCLVRTGERWQPLVAVVPKARLAGLQDFWAAGGRAPLRWLLGQAHTVMQLPDADPRLFNANHPLDWEAEHAG